MNNTNKFLAGFNPTVSGAYLHIISTVKTGSDINVTYLGASGDSTYSGGPASRTNVLEFTPVRLVATTATASQALVVTDILSGGLGSAW